MADQWFYRMLGQEFGPMPFQDLKQLAESGAISSTDEVRSEHSKNWAPANSVRELGLEQHASNLDAARTAESDLSEENSLLAEMALLADFTLASSSAKPVSADRGFAKSDDVAANEDSSLSAEIALLADLIQPTDRPRPKEPGVAEAKDDSAVADAALLAEMAMLADMTLPSGKPKSSGFEISELDEELSEDDAFLQASMALLDDMAQTFDKSSASTIPDRVRSSQSDAKPVEPASDSSTDDQWFCKIDNEELGPLQFNELVNFAEGGQLTADDEVKLGSSGKWRRTGSIGRLVAVLPFRESKNEEQKIPETPVAAPAQPVAAILTPGALPNDPVSDPLIVAQQAFAVANQNARAHIAWAMAPNIDPAWWGWIGGVEHGPVRFLQIYEWALAGRFQMTDFIKNGMYGQYVPSTHVPGLFSAVAIVRHAMEALKAAQLKPAAPVAVEPAAVAPSTSMKPVEAAKPAEPSKPAPAVKTEPQTSAKAPEDGAAVPAKAEPPAEPVKVSPLVAPPSEAPKPAFASSVSSSSGFGGSSSSPMRPKPMPVRSQRNQSSSSLSESFASLFQNSQLLGGIAVAILMVGGIVYVAMNFANKGKDIERYRNVKQLMDDVRAARSGSKNFEPLKERAKELMSKYVDALNVEADQTKPAKQELLWTIRDELPQLMNGDLSKESVMEKSIDKRLQDVAKILGVN